MASRPEEETTGSNVDGADVQQEAPEVDFVTLGMFIIGMLFVLNCATSLVPPVGPIDCSDAAVLQVCSGITCLLILGLPCFVLPPSPTYMTVG